MPFDGEGFSEQSGDEIALLLVARNLLRTRQRWWRGKQFSLSDALGETRHCAMMALSAATAADFNYQIFQLAHKRLKDQLPAQFAGIVARFNDDPGTTHADVLALFDRAIEA